jgi:3-oxoadipate enol-lactonase
MPFARRDVDVYYVDQGHGEETLFFCHGAGGNSTSWWQQIPEFGSRYRCLAHDHRSFGRSRCPMDRFTVTAFADDARAVLDAAGVERAHFVCQSMGGWTGVQMALRYPDRISTLVLADTIGGIALPSGLDATRGMNERAAAAGALHPALAADYPRLDPRGAFLYLQLSEFNTDLVTSELFRHLFRQDALVPLAQAATLDLPVLIVAGQKDLIWGPEILHELAGHLPNAQVVEVDAGHSAYFEAPGAFNRALDAFLASHRG